MCHFRHIDHDLLNEAKFKNYPNQLDSKRLTRNIMNYTILSYK